MKSSIKVMPSDQIRICARPACPLYVFIGYHIYYFYNLCKNELKIGRLADSDPLED